MSWLVARWRMLGLGLALVLIAGGAVVAVNWSALTRDPSCQQTEAATAAEASALALLCDSDVEVLELRSAWNTSWATADGTTRLEMSSVPVRTDVTGEWTDVDLSIEESGDGLAVAAPVSPTTLSGGGDEPLGTVGDAGHVFAVWFPGDLPEPTTDGSRVFYQLLDGVRLIVNVDPDGIGFVPVVELADRAASVRFTEYLEGLRAADGLPGAGIDIPYRTEISDGLTMELVDGKAVDVIDADGEVRFQAHSAFMWDSSGELAAVGEEGESGQSDRLASPAGGDRIEAMPMSLAEDSIVISPSRPMLEAADTKWPVYIDPSFGTRGANERIAIRTGAFTSSLHNWTSSSGLGAGRCNVASSSACNATFVERLVWNFTGLGSLGGMAGSDVTSAIFRVNGVSSFNCTQTNADVYRTNPISSGSTWGNTSFYQHLSSSSDAFRSGQCGAPGIKSFDVKAAAQWTADVNADYVALGLKAGDESTMTGWKRWQHDATLTIDYNRAPAVSGQKFDDPAISTCTTATASRPVIRDSTPTLSAIASDPDKTNTQVQFQITLTNASTVVYSSGWRTAVTSGTRSALTVPSGKLVSGTSYYWRTQAIDPNQRKSPWGPWCSFTLDTTAPVAPKITPVTTGVAAIYATGHERGGVGLQGKFTIDDNGATDVVKFKYGFTPSMTTTVNANSSGQFVVSHTPTTAGPATLYAASIDRAGLVSTRAEYRFDVATPVETGIWKLDEGQGTTSAEDTTSEAGMPMRISGATWVDGPHQDFGSRDGDHALRFNGTSHAATTDDTLLDTRESFTVSAFVKIDASVVGTTAARTAMSQDGVAQSGFRLGYVGDCQTSAGVGCWAFSMPNSASSSASTRVVSSVPVRADEWVALVAEHNAQTGTMRMWACNIGTPESPAPGIPERSATATRTGAPWAATGAFLLGRSWLNSASAERWSGAIDNVRVFDGQVITEAKIRRMCQGAEATDFGDGGADALDPTKADVQ